ncbi:hypothetical protein AAE478_006228 [Parahypoxylon ruwenzoriense]
MASVEVLGKRSHYQDNVEDEIASPTKRIQHYSNAKFGYDVPKKDMQDEQLAISSGSLRVEGLEPQIPVPRPFPFANNTGPTLPFLFDRYRSPQHMNIDIEDLVSYDEEKQVSHLRKELEQDCSERRVFRIRQTVVDSHSLVIHVKGLSRDNGARGGWAVYFGPRSQYNARGVLSRAVGDPPITSVRAEAEALGHALDMVSSINEIPQFGGIRWIVIASDSSPLINPMVGAPISKYTTIELGMLMELRAILERVRSQAVCGNGAYVRFWHVSRRENGEARKLVEDVIS